MLVDLSEQVQMSEIWSETACRSLIVLARAVRLAMVIVAERRNLVIPRTVRLPFCGYLYAPAKLLEARTMFAVWRDNKPRFSHDG